MGRRAILVRGSGSEGRARKKHSVAGSRGMQNFELPYLTLSCPPEQKT